MSVYIRRMREEDIPQVVEIEKIAFSRPWSKSVFKAALLLPYAAYYVAAENGLAGPAAAAAKNGNLPGSFATAAENSIGSPGSCTAAAENEPQELSASCSSGGLQGTGRAALQTEKIVGMCGVKKIFEEGDISNVAVHPAWRGRGISRQMLEMLMREAREDGVTQFTLEVRAGNVPAIRLYESYGFVTEGVRPRFYEDPVEDGLVMWLR